MTRVLQHIENQVLVVCKIFDAVAGLSLLSVMLLVSGNVLMRAIWKNPVLGTYEYVGFLTSLGVGLAIANCALKNGHIAVGFLVAKLPARVRAVIDGTTNTIAAIFFTLCAWEMFVYAGSFVTSGEVGLTTRIPFYPFVYGLVTALALLCLVLYLRAVEMFRMAVRS